MSDQFYGRQQEVRRQQERGGRKSHETMETWQLEQDRARIEKPYGPEDGDVAPPPAGWFARLWASLRRTLGGR